tara:strand:- start:683 stop:895 length:213 start_codon:yes stop_codon:yes gene_type:complete
MKKSPTRQDKRDGALSTAGVAAGHGQVFCKGQTAMAEEQLKAFLEKVKDDSNLQDKLIATKSPEEVMTNA